MDFMSFMLESSFRSELSVPQNPKHHPEGDVFRHTFMVRSSLSQAIEYLKKQQIEDPDGPFSNLDLNLTQEDMNVLRLGGLLHDIGKKSSVDLINLTTHGHDNPKIFEKGMQNLGPVWKKMYQNASQEDKEILWFVIANHMNMRFKLGDGKNSGLSSSLRGQMIDSNGKFRNDRKNKLLMIIMIMDRMGRGGVSNMPSREAKRFAQSNTSGAEEGIAGFRYSSQLEKEKQEKILRMNKSAFSGQPNDLVKMMRAKGLSDNVIKNSVRNKYPNLTADDINAIMSV